MCAPGTHVVTTPSAGSSPSSLLSAHRRSVEKRRHGSVDGPAHPELSFQFFPAVCSYSHHNASTSFCRIREGAAEKMDSIAQFWLHEKKSRQL